MAGAPEASDPADAQRDHPAVGEDVVEGRNTVTPDCVEDEKLEEPKAQKDSPDNEEPGPRPASRRPGSLDVILR